MEIQDLSRSVRRLTLAVIFGVILIVGTLAFLKDRSTDTEIDLLKNRVTVLESEGRAKDARIKRLERDNEIQAEFNRKLIQFIGEPWKQNRQ